MLVNTSQSHSYQPVFRRSRLLGRGLIVAFAALSLITGLGISELTARSGIEPSGETVNRTLKGDRWSPPFRLQTNAAHRPSQTNAPPPKKPQVPDYRSAANRLLARSHILSWHVSRAIACRRRH
jgi:hypothetical protein